MEVNINYLDLDFKIDFILSVLINYVLLQDFLHTTQMSIKISASAFVEKYKLIPTQLRRQYLDFLREMPYMYDEEDWKLDVFDDLIMNLVMFGDSDDYEFLEDTLVDNVMAFDNQVYYDVISCLLRYLKWMVPIITHQDVLIFHKRQVLRQIKEDVAYRPGNVGYDETKLHFESMLKYFN